MIDLLTYFLCYFIKILTLHFLFYCCVNIIMYALAINNIIVNNKFFSFNCASLTYGIFPADSMGSKHDRRVVSRDTHIMLVATMLCSNSQHQANYAHCLFLLCMLLFSLYF